MTSIGSHMWLLFPSPWTKIDDENLSTPGREKEPPTPAITDKDSFYFPGLSVLLADRYSKYYTYLIPDANRVMGRQLLSRHRGSVLTADQEKNLLFIFCI